MSAWAALALLAVFNIANKARFVSGFVSKIGSERFKYIEMFYNSKRRHGPNGQCSPLECKKAYFYRAMCV